ncbi:MAG TPA: diacylglycerol kinase family protein [Flavitalea sp.]|nr:diacylglycerol kinase family protein [Flavitalea sp.]
MIKKHLASYRFAMRGILQAFRYERNMAIHSLASLAVLITNYVLGISRTEWIITVLLIGAVWSAEVFNTAIEKLADRVSKDFDPMVGLVKDLAAGAVLIVCFTAVVCAVFIYWPYLF